MGSDVKIGLNIRPRVNNSWTPTHTHGHAHTLTRSHAHTHKRERAHACPYHLVGELIFSKSLKAFLRVSTGYTTSKKEDLILELLGFEVIRVHTKLLKSKTCAACGCCCDGGCGDGECDDGRKELRGG